MAQRFIHVFSSVLVILLAYIEATKAVNYTALNTAGGRVFLDKIGAAYARQTMDSATKFIWRIFQQQNSPADRKNLQQVKLIVEDIDGLAFTIGSEVLLSERYVGHFYGDLKMAVTGVLYHEMTHVWQWNGNGQANRGLIEGIADYVRLKPGYIPSH